MEAVIDEQIKLTVKKTVIQTFGVSEEAATDRVSFVTDLGADSLDVAEIIMEVESEFGIAIPEEDLETVGYENLCIGELSNIVKKHL